MEPGWLELLGDVFAQPYMQSLREFLRAEKQRHQVFPPSKEIFSAFWLTPPEQVKAIIIGQDPYHGPNQANGLCFSVARDAPLPPSLENIYTELRADVHVDRGRNGDLSGWARQGVLLLNSILTVRAHSPASHRNKGWEAFTDQVFQRICTRHSYLAIVAWGGFAQNKIGTQVGQEHLLVKSPHPSPLSAHRGFFGSRPFSQVNSYLSNHGISPIDWSA